MPLTRQRATVQCCGRRDGPDFSDAARAFLERHQISHVSDPHPARCIWARIAGARLSLSVVAIRAGIRIPPRQSGSWLRRAADLAWILYALPGRVRHILFQDPSDCQVAGQQIGIGDASTAAFQLQRTMGTTLPGSGFLEPIAAPNVVRAIYFNGITQDPRTYRIDPTTGLVTFETAPSSELIITADFTYYFRVDSLMTNTISRISCIGCGR